ncbi:hypothetical protein AYI68_g5114 [Smittium mucronatum]|uniref:Uncharacterized protein n=1 Tax=Smittium mucronatum TaxID=133383 RepID=A0A1R0GV80_9FUNG|nr:hypothetical protein AYI68_g5114 [Smittium mucronatum]
MTSCLERNSFLNASKKPKMGNGLYGNFYFIACLVNGISISMRAEIIKHDYSQVGIKYGIYFSEIEILSNRPDYPVLSIDYKNRLVVLGRMGSVEILSKDGKKWNSQNLIIPTIKSFIGCQISGGYYYDLGTTSRLYLGTYDSKIYVLKKDTDTGNYVRDYSHEKFVNKSLHKLLSGNSNIIIDQISLNGLLLSANERYLFVQIE